MYETLLNRIAIIATIVFVLVAGTGFGIQAVRLQAARAECERFRIELEYARNREREFTNTITAIEESTGRAAEILRNTGGSIQSIKDGIQEVKKYVNEMENYVISLRSKYNDSDLFLSQEEFLNDTKRKD